MTFPRFHALLALFIVSLGVLAPANARADGYAWDDSTCAAGGSWMDTNCWSGSGYPDGIDDSAFIQLDAEGGVAIPTSSIFNIELNGLTLTENVSLSVGKNMFLVMAMSSTGTDPYLQVDNVLTVSSQDFGSSVLQAGTPLDPEATCELEIYGSGEIRLGSNGSLAAATRAEILVNGGVEVVSSASETQPAKIMGEVRIVGGEIRVLGGPLQIGGDVEMAGGAFAEIFDQFATGKSEIRVTGRLSGGKLHPGLGVVRMNGGTLADIDIQPGPIEVSGPLAHFAGEVSLSGGTEVTIPPTRTLQIGGDAVAGAPLLRNDGVIRVGDATDGAAYLRNDGSLVDLAGTGTVVLAHFGSQLTSLTATGVFRNGPGHTIEGQGYIQSAVQNQGLLVADAGRLIVFKSVTGPTGDTVVQGTSGSPGELEVRAGFSTRNLRIDEHGILDAGGRSVVVHGDWIVETVDESATVWSGGSLVFAGAGVGQGFETTSEDLGAVSAGFSGNFAIPRVAIGQNGTLVFLRDLRDNGNRTLGDEAVYADQLEVQPGATLNLNGYCFYTKVDGLPYRVQAGDGALFGGGTIVDDPSTVTSVGDAPVRAGLDAIHVAPNPFNPRTTIRFELGEFADGRITIHDLRGRRVRALAEGPWNRGVHELVWDGRDDAGAGLASGVYAVRVRVGDAMRVQRVTLLK